MAPPVRDAWASDPQDVSRLKPKADALKGYVDQLIRKRVDDTVPRPGARVVTIPLVFGSPGTALTAGTWVHFPLELNRDVRIVRFTVGGLPSGSCVVDVRTAAKGSLASAASICGGNKPTLSSATEADDQDPTGWTADVADGTWLVGVVESASTVETVSVTLRALVVEPEQRA